MSSEAPKRIEIIHYLRGRASLVVAWFHLTNQWSDAVRDSGFYCWLGVEAFFVISGFVIPYSISKTYKEYSVKAFADFIARRFLRIEVPYILSIFVVIVLGYSSSFAPAYHGQVPNYTFAQIASNVFYVAHWTGQEWMQPVYWTLAYEFVFYLTVGLLFGFLFQKGSPIMFNFAAAILVLAVACKLLSPLILLFVIGAAVFKFGAESKYRYMALLIAVICSITVTLRGSFAIALTGIATAALIAFGSRFHANGLFGKVMTYLGTISYSLYLLHIPLGGRVVNLGARLVHGQLQHLALSLLALSVSLVSAHIFYVAIERPTQLRAKQLVLVRMKRDAKESTEMA